MAGVDGEHRRAKASVSPQRVLRSHPPEHRFDGSGGEPGAVRVARRVRRAGRGDGLGESLEPRPGSTLRPTPVGSRRRRERTSTASTSANRTRGRCHSSVTGRLGPVCQRRTRRRTTCQTPRSVGRPPNGDGSSAGSRMLRVPGGSSHSFRYSRRMTTTRSPVMARFRSGQDRAPPGRSLIQQVARRGSHGSVSTQGSPHIAGAYFAMNMRRAWFVRSFRSRNSAHSAPPGRGANGSYRRRASASVISSIRCSCCAAIPGSTARFEGRLGIR